MKRIKSFISLLLAFAMLMSLSPISFAEDAASINIETTAGYYNIEEAMSFYASIPAGYTNISVYADGNQVENAVTTLADNRCKITIPANTFTKYPYAQISITADDGNGNTLTAERMINTYDPTSTTNMINTDFSKWDSTYADSFSTSSATGLKTLLQALGFYDQNISDATLVRKTALAGKGTDDVSLALAGPREKTNTANIDLRNGKSTGTFYPTVLTASFNLYPAGSETFVLTANDGTLKEYNIDLTDGVWNRVSVQYNYDEDRAVVLVDDGTAITSSFYDDFTLTELKLIRFRFTPGQEASSFIAIDDIKVDCHETIAKRFELTSPTNGETVTGEFTAKATAIDAEKVYLYVDGVKNAEQTGTTGKQDYSFTLSPADIGYGDKEIRVVAVYADGTMDSGSAVVSAKEVVEEELASGKTKELIEFNNLEDWTDRIVTSADVDTMKNNYTWYVDAAKPQKVSRIAGRSGKAGDYALEVESSDGLKTGVGGFMLFFNNATPEIDGTYILDFDMKVNTDKDKIRLLGPQLWGYTGNYTTQNFFIYNGKIIDTEYEVTPDKWIHYNLKLENGFWYVTVYEYDDVTGEPINEQLVVNRRPPIGSNIGKGPQFVMYQSADRTEGEYAGFAIDNAKVWIEKSVDSVKVESLTYDDTQTVSNHIVPYTAETLTVNLDRAVTEDEISAELYVNNEIVNADIAIDSAAVTVTLPKLEAGSKLKVVLKDTAGILADVSTFAYVSNASGLYTGCLDYFEDDGQFIAHTMTASDVRFSGIVASYSDNFMTDVDIYDIFAPAGDSCTMLSVPSNIKTKVMLWDSMDTINPLGKSSTFGE